MACCNSSCAWAAAAASAESLCSIAVLFAVPVKLCNSAREARRFCCGFWNSCWSASEVVLSPTTAARTLPLSRLII